VLLHHLLSLPYATVQFHPHSLPGLLVQQGPVDKLRSYCCLPFVSLSV